MTTKYLTNIVNDNEKEIMIQTKYYIKYNFDGAPKRKFDGAQKVPCFFFLVTPPERPIPAFSLFFSLFSTSSQNLKFLLGERTKMANITPVERRTKYSKNTPE